MKLAMAPREADGHDEVPRGMRRSIGPMARGWAAYPGGMERYRLGALTIDAGRKTVRGPDGELELYPKTVEVLIELVREAPSVSRRLDLIDRVWPEGFVVDQNLTQRIYQLRRALVPYGIEIHTVRGVGYRLDAEPERIESDDLARRPAAVARYEEASELVDRNEVGKAVCLLEEARDLEPGWCEVRTGLAWGYMWLGRPEDAKRELETARDLAHHSTGPQRLEVDALYCSFSGDAEGAVDRYELVREHKPDDYWLHVALMGLFQLVGRVDDAEAMLEELERIRPGFPMTRWQAGFHLLFERGDLTGAAAEFERFADAVPEHPLPLASMMPALVEWDKGRLDAALESLDALHAERFDRLSAVGRSQLLVFRSRLLAEMGETEAACEDQALAAALFDGAAPFGSYHRLELALLLDEQADPAGRELLDTLAQAPSAFLRAQALGWSGIAAARAGHTERAQEIRRRLRELDYDGGWVWGYPTRPAFDRTKAIFPLLITAHLALVADDPARAYGLFARARRASPERMSVVPVVSLDGRARTAATEGLALAARALGEHHEASQADRWIRRHRLETVILAQAGAGFYHRAVQRSEDDQPAGTTSAIPIE